MKVELKGLLKTLDCSSDQFVAVSTSVHLFTEGILSFN